jgi:hypothetical protein
MASDTASSAVATSTVNAAMIYQYATSKRDREIAAGIDRRLAEALEADEPDNDSDGDGLGGVLVPVG